MAPRTQRASGTRRGRGATGLRLGWLLLAALASGCRTWTPVHVGSGWTLYVKDDTRVDVDHFGAALDPAFAAVEVRMGAFRDRVRIHAWDGETVLEAGRGGMRVGAEGGELEPTRDLGPARVRAFHVRGGTQLFQSSGVFLGAADVGTAVHELVHARLAELAERLPLWFEEGLASLYGDGALFDGAWAVDGLACWPLRELRQQDLGDQELARLLAISARDDYDARENLLVHFVGWAVVFDLRRELPEGSWSEWLALYREGARLRGGLREARTRLDRTLSWQTHVQWLNRLDSVSPPERFAAAKGIWKLESRSAIDRLLDRLEHEQHPQVRYALALNCMLATGEMRLGRERWWRMRRLVFPALKEPGLDDADEQAAALALYASLRSWNPAQRERLQEAIATLARFWEE
jgi:hypothetical protein